MDENLIGAATLPIQALLDAPNGELDVWLEALAPGKQASEQEMADASFQLRAWRRRHRDRGGGWKAGDYNRPLYEPQLSWFIACYH